MEETELYTEILIGFLKNERAEVRFPDLRLAPEAIVAQGCYRALRKIKDVLEDDTLEDVDCLERIEKIVQIFEELESAAGFGRAL